MKVNKLILELSKFNPDDEVEIMINNVNKPYPVAYTKVTSVLNTINGLARISTYLPHDMHTVKRKKHRNDQLTILLRM